MDTVEHNKDSGEDSDSDREMDSISQEDMEQDNMANFLPSGSPEFSLGKGVNPYPDCVVLHSL